MPGFWSLFKKPAADAASTLIGSVTSFVDEIVTNKEERAQLKMQAEKQIQDYAVKIEELAQSAEKMFIEDKQNARDMQKAALMQNDIFSKRFAYYLALGILGFTVVYDILLLTNLLNDSNQDVVYFIAGVINSGGFMTVVNFFFGSSKGSSDKQDKLNTILENKK
jgi:hypothetical protein